MIEQLALGQSVVMDLIYHLPPDHHCHVFAENFVSLLTISPGLLLGTGQHPLHQFSRSKSVTSWRGQKSVVSVVSCCFPNSIAKTCCGLVGRVANKSATSWQLPSKGFPRLPGKVCNGFWEYMPAHISWNSDAEVSCNHGNKRPWEEEMWGI